MTEAVPLGELLHEESLQNWKEVNVGSSGAPLEKRFAICVRGSCSLWS